MTMTEVDLLSDILRSIRLQGSVFFRSHLSAPWGIDLPGANEPRFHLVLEGEAWVCSSTDEQPFRIPAGTAVFLRDGEAHWIADSPNTPRISSEEASSAYENGNPLFEGARTDCHMLCGRFEFNREIQHPLLETLPPLSILSAASNDDGDWVQQTGALMDRELVGALPGNAAMMDRLCELFLIQVLRYLADHEGHAAGFIAALDDKPINRALRLIHTDPARPWDLQSLASAAGLSRSAFASRFHELVGVPPKAYLTMWRMQKARSLLRNPYKLLGQIAGDVGYSSDVALIRAFQRHFGKSPKEMRRELANESQTSTTN
ncbi:MAG: AraC family transcriptional regulator [Pseudomonadota bacterium]